MLDRSDSVFYGGLSGMKLTKITNRLVELLSSEL